MANQRPPLHIEMFARLGARQMKLIEGVSAAIKEINSLKTSVQLKEIDRAIDEGRRKFTSFEEEALQLERAFDQPDLLQTDEERKELKKDQNKAAKTMFEYMQTIRGGEAPDRRNRISVLLERYEKRISEKRDAAYFNKTAGFSRLAIAIAALSLLVTVFSSIATLVVALNN